MLVLQQRLNFLYLKLVPYVVVIFWDRCIVYIVETVGNARLLYASFSNHAIHLNAPTIFILNLIIIFKV